MFQNLEHVVDHNVGGYKLGHYLGCSRLPSVEYNLGHYIGYPRLLWDILRLYPKL